MRYHGADMLHPRLACVKFVPPEKENRLWCTYRETDQRTEARSSDARVEKVGQNNPDPQSELLQQHKTQNDRKEALLNHLRLAIEVCKSIDEDNHHQGAPSLRRQSGCLQQPKRSPKTTRNMSKRGSEHRHHVRTGIPTGIPCKNCNIVPQTA